MDKLYKLAQVPSKERGLVALQAMRKGQLLFAERPIVSCLREAQLGRYCSYCFTPLAASEVDDSTLDTFHVDCNEIFHKNLHVQHCGVRNRDCVFLFVDTHSDSLHFRCCA